MRAVADSFAKNEVLISRGESVDSVRGLLFSNRGEESPTGCGSMGLYVSSPGDSVACGGVAPAREIMPSATSDCANSMPGLLNSNARKELPLDCQRTTSVQVPFEHGDAFGQAKRSAAIYEAAKQRELQPEGSPREALYRLQERLGDLPDVEFPLQHVFAPGALARTIQIPAKSWVVGKIHKHAHLNILSQGTVHVFTEEGGMEVLVGPLTMCSAPGTKRALYAVTDVVWTVVHLTESTDLATIESEVIAETYADYEQFLLTH